MKNFALILLSILLTACNFSFSLGDESDLPEPTAGTMEQRQEAEAAAWKYLRMIDGGDFQGTWDQAGPTLRSQSSEFAWKNMLKLSANVANHAPVRELEGIGFSTRIDARVPVGDYVAVQFKHATTSENVTTTEKVVMERH